MEACKGLSYSRQGLYFQPAGPENRRRAEGEAAMQKVDHNGPPFTLKNFNQESNMTGFCKGRSGYNVDKNGSGDTKPEAGVPTEKLCGSASEQR